jgi:hypothetical protein
VAIWISFAIIFPHCKTNADVCFSSFFDWISLSCSFIASLLLAIFIEITLQYTMTSTTPKYVKEMLAVMKENETVILPALFVIYEWFCYNTGVISFDPGRVVISLTS